LSPLVIAVGDFPDAHPSISFLFHPWTMPTLLDWIIMSGLGFVWAGGMYFLARAYSVAPASVVAPFEYLALPINITWGFLLWHEIPTVLTLAGATLTIGSGLYILYREQREREQAAKGKQHREKSVEQLDGETTDWNRANFLEPPTSSPNATKKR